MKKIGLVILFCLTLFNFLVAQDIFTVKIDGITELTSIQQTTDSGHVVAGSTQVPGQRFDLYIAKMDKDQNLQWTKTMGGLGDDAATCLVVSGDNNLVVAGNVQEFKNFQVKNSYIAIIKLDSAGNIIWHKTMGSGENGVYCSATSIANTADGGYIITGDAFINGQRDVYILKLDSAGNAQWASTTGHAFLSDAGESVIQCSDGGYAVAGYTYTINVDGLRNTQMYVIKLASDGKFEWKKLIGQDYVETQYTNRASSILQAEDGGFIVAGVDAVLNVDAYLKVVKLNSVGELVWAKVASWLQTDALPNVDIIEGHDGSYLCTGIFWDSTFKFRNYLFELTPDGAFKFATAFEKHDYPFTSLCKTFDKGYALVTADGEIYKLDSNFSSCSPSFDARQGTFYTAYVTTPASNDSNWSVFTGNVQLNISSGGDLITLCSTLPLRLLSFVASRNGTVNTLQWNTSNETNTNYFEVQRSSDGRNFYAIAKVAAANQLKNTYSFTDAHPVNGTNYYRLLISDKDARKTYSGIRSVNNSEHVTVSISPNPVKETLTLKFNSARTMDAQIAIVNAEGRMVFFTKMHVEEGFSFQKINTPLLSKGYYFLKCVFDEGTTGLRFVKE